MNPLKKLARWILRVELAQAALKLTVAEAMFKVTDEQLDEAVSNHQETKEKLRSVENALRHARSGVGREMETWARKASCNHVLAWAQYLQWSQPKAVPSPAGGPWVTVTRIGATQDVHPFDRWGVSPKP